MKYMYSYMICVIHCLYIFFVFPLQVHIQGIAACSFGNNLTQLTSSSQSGLIVNTANVAQCPGNATTWNMCYYSSTTDQSSTVYIGVYRSGNNQYALVPGSPSNYTISKPQSSPTYSCINFSIPLSQQFMVQMGDVIAACVQPSGGGTSGGGGDVPRGGGDVPRGGGDVPRGGGDVPRGGGGDVPRGGGDVPRGGGCLGIVASTNGSAQILVMMMPMCGPLPPALPSPIMGLGIMLLPIALHVSLGMSYS